MRLGSDSDGENAALDVADLAGADTDTEDDSAAEGRSEQSEETCILTRGLGASLRMVRAATGQGARGETHRARVRALLEPVCPGAVLMEQAFFDCVWGAIQCSAEWRRLQDTWSDDEVRTALRLLFDCLCVRCADGGEACDTAVAQLPLDAAALALGEWLGDPPASAR
jgi:hypothetical protein